MSKVPLEKERAAAGEDRDRAGARSPVGLRHVAGVDVEDAGVGEGMPEPRTPVPVSRVKVPAALLLKALCRRRPP